MKKKITISIVIFVLIYLVLNVADARADVYVKVDANGNAIGGAIMCDAGTCGAGSEYSRLTLQAGERYVLQGTGQAGIGNNNPNTQVKVDLQNNEWTITRQVEVKPIEPIVINNQPVISYTTQVVEKFTPATSPGNDRPAPVVIQPTPLITPPTMETTTAFVETRTATVETATVSIVSRSMITPIATLSMSDVIWGLKDQVVTIKKETAKALIRKKGKK